MPDGAAPLLIAIIILLLLSGFFSSMETAYSCANKVKLRTMSANGNARAAKTLKLAENYDKLISTILVGNNIVNITTSSLATLFFASLMTNSANSVTVSTVVTTVAVLIFGEITPKMMAKVYPEKFSMVGYPLIMLFYYILFPINIVFTGYKFVLSKIFKLKNEEVVTEDEIMTIVEEAREGGTLPPGRNQTDPFGHRVRRSGSGRHSHPPREYYRRGCKSLARRGKKNLHFLRIFEDPRL